MKAINLQVEGKNVSVNIEDVIKTKHMRQLFPIINNMKGDEINSTIEIAKILFVDLDGNSDLKNFEEFVDELDFHNMTKFMEEIGNIITEATSKKK